MIDNKLDRDAFVQTLRRGGYNLLLGAGATADSRNSRGDLLGTADTLRSTICKAVGLPHNVSLQMAARSLTTSQVRRLLTQRYSNCQPSEWIRSLPDYIWKCIYTFNIDDVLESAWKKSNSKQKANSINYDDNFKSNRGYSDLDIIHLHGYSMKPNSGYVFSYTDYARILKKPNPWLNVLGDQITSEPFIIAGTRLGEVDLEFYLKDRSQSTPRSDTGPSLLIEPYPVPRLTKSECKRLGLLHINASFEDFLNWVKTQLPFPPSILELVVPDENVLFESSAPSSRIRFFTDWRLRRSTTPKKIRSANSGFFWGSPPNWTELENQIDIVRDLGARVESAAIDLLSDTTKASLIRITGEPGTGKTTTLLRAGYKLSSQGFPVFTVQTHNEIDVANTVKVIENSDSDLVFIIDNLANHVRQVAAILDSCSSENNILILAAERGYREDHVSSLLRGIPQVIFNQSTISESEALQLTERYRELGLLAGGRGPDHKELPASKFNILLQSDSISVAVCHILNDFKPLDRIIESLWKDSTDVEKNIFTVSSLAYDCNRRGIQRALLQQIIGSHISIDMIEKKGSLPVISEDGYIRPLSPAIGEHLIKNISKEISGREILFNSFINLANEIAPYVNISTLKYKTPESLIARRIFDANLCQSLLFDLASDFYEQASEAHGWNSRFWQQRAKYESNYRLDIAIQYAEHSLRIEHHAFGFTVLGQLQMKSIGYGNTNSDLYEDAFRNLERAINWEKKNKRPAIHPYISIFNGTADYIRHGKEISQDKVDRIDDLVMFAEDEFLPDRRLEDSISNLDKYLAS